LAAERTATQASDAAARQAAALAESQMATVKSKASPLYRTGLWALRSVRIISYAGDWCAIAERPPVSADLIKILILLPKKFISAGYPQNQ